MSEILLDEDENTVLRDRFKAAQLRADILVDALPYIRKFYNKIIVIKYGGNAMVDPELAARFAEDIVLLQAVGCHPVVVHGGGPQIGDLMKKLGKVPEFHEGHRVTDAETLDIARMVLVGKVNREIVAALNMHGPLAVGLSGEDAGLIEANEKNPALGFVGDIKTINPSIIQRLLSEQLIPVISTIGADLQGQAYNINADTAAGAIAGALQAEKVVYLTDVPGLLSSVDDPTSVIEKISITELEEMRAHGKLTGGMIPKIDSCIQALAEGVVSAHLLDGRLEHAVLLELFTSAGIGTMITSD